MGGHAIAHLIMEFFYCELQLMIHVSEKINRLSVRPTDL